MDTGSVSVSSMLLPIILETGATVALVEVAPVRHLRSMKVGPPIAKFMWDLWQNLEILRSSVAKTDMVLRRVGHHGPWHLCSHNTTIQLLGECSQEIELLFLHKNTWNFLSTFNKAPKVETNNSNVYKLIGQTRCSMFIKWLFSNLKKAFSTLLQGRQILKYQLC